MEEENEGRMTRKREGKKGLVQSDSSCMSGLFIVMVHVTVHCSCPQT
jgi:hypothetical protein